MVSTHSRPKAAANAIGGNLAQRQSFNTQPPEGGCVRSSLVGLVVGGFNTQPPEGGCREREGRKEKAECFNTQPPEGGCPNRPNVNLETFRFQHTAARRRLRADVVPGLEGEFVFQHTAARRRLLYHQDRRYYRPQFQHTAARRRLQFQRDMTNYATGLFQHTAARRRLHNWALQTPLVRTVSTHSRPKAAARALKQATGTDGCFNTQPPEGGCFVE